jgi:fatty acid-binding protein DegV
MPPDMIEQYGVGMARYAVRFGDESYLDNGIDLPVEAFDAKRQSSGIVPKTGILSGQLWRSIARSHSLATIYSIHVGTS